MEIEALINKLEDMAFDSFMQDYEDGEEICLKAAQTIRLLWEVAKDTNNERYRMLFDEQEVNHHGG